MGCSEPEGADTGPDSEADAGLITAEDLYARSASWPNIVKMAEAWTTPSGKLLKQSYRGVLIRVPADARLARIDFGRHGVHDVPFGRTNIVEQANAVRTGEEHKVAPNFVLLVGTKLVDSSHDRRDPMPSSRIASGRVFLCVFADPKEPGFEEIVSGLGELRASEGLHTLYFPQKVPLADLNVLKARLRALDWAVPMVPVASYTRSLLRPEQEPPYALLVTPEGRLLHGTRLGQAGAPAELQESIDASARSSEPASQGPPPPR